MLSASRHLRRYAVLFLLPLVLLAGCVKIDAAMDIKDEDHIHVKVTMGMSKSAASMSQQNIMSELSDCSDVYGLGSGVRNAKGEEFEDDQYIGCTFSSDVTATEFNAGVGSKIIFDKDKVTFTMDAGYFDDVAGVGVPRDTSLITAFTLSVTFPGKVLSHSGSSTVDGSTVTWTDPHDVFSSAGLSATGERSKGAPVWVWILVVAVALGATGVAVGVVRKNKSESDKDDSRPAMPYAGQPQNQQPHQWRGQPYQDSRPYQDSTRTQQPPHQSPGQHQPGQPWGSFPGSTTTGPQAGQDPASGRGAQPSQQPPPDPDEFWKYHGPK
ncbi:hypothetical protein [Cutibacterium sp.]|uniref:LppM family (lipo)protein n=1 Tax=Cutibacterium sp. TaxID=1912221 RepID=UPI0026DBAC53|nr:hypothetical protein [Cutibacterium sp.]MDO4413174.1 hypothetical protein [Cutibacterium sp.]